MERRRLETSLYAGVLFAALGAVAWVSGQPFVFPSLGPSAFILAFERTGERTRPERVVGSHVVGGVAGLFAYTVLGTGSIVTLTPEPLSIVGFRLAASATLSVVLTSWGMLATDTVHAPACATTLIVSLGLLSTLPQVAIIAVSVVALVTLHRSVLALVQTVLEEG